VGEGKKVKSRRKQLYISWIHILLASLAIAVLRVYIDNDSWNPIVVRVW